MKEIKMYEGLTTMIDDEDFEYLNQWKWTVRKCDPTNYAIRFSSRRNGKQQKPIRMHRVILNATKEMEVDHIDHNGLNNQRTNLRLVTKQENAFNRKDVKGYSFNKNANKWAAHIHLNGKKKHLGYFKTEKKAHKAYLKAKKKYHIIKQRTVRLKIKENNI